MLQFIYIEYQQRPFMTETTGSALLPVVLLARFRLLWCRVLCLWVPIGTTSMWFWVRGVSGAS